MHDPFLAPHGRLDRMEERGILFAKRALKACAHAHAEHIDAEEIILILGGDQNAVFAQGNTGNDEVDVWVVDELAA